MNNLTLDISKYQEPKKAPKFYWQEQALLACDYLENAKKSVVFKWFKLKEQKATTALRYMQSRNIKNFYYMAKLMAIK